VAKLVCGQKFSQFTKFMVACQLSWNIVTDKGFWTWKLQQLPNLLPKQSLKSVIIHL